ncbi:MAG: Gfo/Idh/MocA family protein [Opitutales bacterium]
MIRIGVIGAGNNGRGHARKFASMPERCQVVAIADPQRSLAQAACEEVPTAKPVEDFAQFFDDVDMVVISSPNWMHVDHLEAVVQAGKHVWCEKPVAVNRAEAQRALDLLEASSVHSFVGVSVRFNWKQRVMKDYLDSGKLGEPINAFSRRLHFYQPDKLIDGWRGDAERSGGVIHELITHEVDWICFLLGLPTDIACHAYSFKKDHPRANDYVSLLLRYPDGVSGSIEGSHLATAPEFRNGLMGREAALFTDQWNRYLYFQPAGDKAPTQLEEAPSFDKHAHFLDVLEGKVKCEADAKYGARLALLVEDALDDATRDR